MLILEALQTTETRSQTVGANRDWHHPRLPRDRAEGAVDTWNACGSCVEDGKVRICQGNKDFGEAVGKTR